MNTKTIFGLLAAATLLAGCREQKNYVDYVNPMIGATTSISKAGVYHGLGKTYPGAVVPFGLVQANPQTITGGDNASGYSDELTTIEGFSIMQMSGTGWYGDFGNFLVMPTTGGMYLTAGREDDSFEGWRSPYDKATETAKAGYYSADLLRYGIKAEMTASTRTAFMKFTYPQSDTSRIQIDLARRVSGSCDYEYVRKVDGNTIEGRIKCTPETGGWGNGDGQTYYTIYFVANIDKALDNCGFWICDIPEGVSRKNNDTVTPEYLSMIQNGSRIVKDAAEAEGKHVGFFTEFPTAEGEQVTLKVSISFVDLEGAWNNYRAEAQGVDFESAHNGAVAAWNEALSKIDIEGGSPTDKILFYTALYHAQLDPRIYTDVDGRYVGGDLKPHENGGKYTKRTIFSGWDVFRSFIPLQTIINPQLVSDLVCSLTDLAEESGKEYYEKWEILNAYSGCMVGNPALSVIAEAWAKGIRDFDLEKAYEFAKNTSAKFGNDEFGYDAGGLGISCTLEYAYTDWCIAQMAKALGKDDEAAIYEQKSQAYRNIFDPQVGWFRPRNADGSWQEWNGDERTHEYYGCIESTPYQQGWFVPHDIDGLLELLGGKDKAIADLENMMEMAPKDHHWNPYYNHGNEPVHLVPYMFNRFGAPWLTQKWTRHICATAYHNKVEGIVGNDDVGQMSAWYVLSAAGIHPSCPAEPSMEITSPVFDKVTFKLDPKYASGKTFTVIAHDNSPENIYIQKALLNGKELQASHISFEDIKAGGTLELFLGSEPQENWGR